MTTPDDPRRDLGRLKLLYDVYRDYMKHEDDLLNQRSTWHIVIQGFLFAALGAMGQWQQPKVLPDTLRMDREDFVYVLTALGIGIAVAASISMQAAHTAIETIRGRWVHDHKAAFDPDVWELLPPLAGGGDADAVEDGKLAARIIPIFIAAAWLVIGAMAALG